MNDLNVYQWVLPWFIRAACFRACPLACDAISVGEFVQHQNDRITGAYSLYPKSLEQIRDTFQNVFKILRRLGYFCKKTIIFLKEKKHVERTASRPFRVEKNTWEDI